ncbi:MAG: hypothetical protein ABSE49_16445 [Polyangiaceae bacterium]|jgi:hypothetical protein
MSEANAVFLDSELLNDAEATNQRPSLSPDGAELKAARLPSITPPPPIHTVGIATLPPVSIPPASKAPAFVHDANGTGTTRFTSEAPGRYASEAPAPSTKPSWLQALLTSTFPPPSALPHAGAAAPISMQTAGTVFAGMGLLFAIVALVTGLRGMPAESTEAPVVVAAYIIARTLVALGAGALSFAMFRQAERLLVQHPPQR